jgi:hypothetical protein
MKGHACSTVTKQTLTLRHTRQNENEIKTQREKTRRGLHTIEQITARFILVIMRELNYDVMQPCIVVVMYFTWRSSMHVMNEYACASVPVVEAQPAVDEVADGVERRAE